MYELAILSNTWLYLENVNLHGLSTCQVSGSETIVYNQISTTPCYYTMHLQDFPYNSQEYMDIWRVPNYQVEGQFLLFIKIHARGYTCIRGQFHQNSCRGITRVSRRRGGSSYNPPKFMPGLAPLGTSHVHRLRRAGSRVSSQCVP